MTLKLRHVRPAASSKLRDIVLGQSPSVSTNQSTCTAYTNIFICHSIGLVSRLGVSKDATDFGYTRLVVYLFELTAIFIF